MKVSELKPGVYFKTLNQRKFRHLEMPPILLDGEGFTYEPDRGKYLLIHDGCKQIVMPPDAEVEVIEPAVRHFRDEIFMDEKRILADIGVSKDFASVTFLRFQEGIDYPQAERIFKQRHQPTTTPAAAAEQAKAARRVGDAFFAHFVDAAPAPIVSSIQD